MPRETRERSSLYLSFMFFFRGLLSDGGATAVDATLAAAAVSPPAQEEPNIPFMVFRCWFRKCPDHTPRATVRKSSYVPRNKLTITLDHERIKKPWWQNSLAV